MNVAHLVLMYLLDSTSAVQQRLQYVMNLSNLNLYALTLCTEKHIVKLVSKSISSSVRIYLRKYHYLRIKRSEIYGQG